jgi:hypothetical protein
MTNLSVLIVLGFKDSIYATVMDAGGHAVQGYGYIAAWTDTTQHNILDRSNKDVKINSFITDGSVYTEPDPIGMLSPNNSGLSGPTKCVSS